MDRDLFEKRFLDAAKRTRDFAQPFLEEELPEAMVFRVHLNASFDGHATPEFRLFPEDGSEDPAFATKGLSAPEVVGELWRDGYVPQWIDLGVAGETGAFTIVDVHACGRFIDDEERLYYTWTDIAPFSPKGPVFPVDYVEGRPFSIHTRTSCWAPDGLSRARFHAPKLWSLALHGPTFDDAMLLSGLAFPNLEILELDGVRLDGRGFAALAGLPRLRILRARFGDTQSLTLSALPILDALEILSLRALPPELTNVGRVAESFPSLRELTLGRARGQVVVERGKGSIFDAGVEAIVNPVNCVGVMGKGLALAFKKKFPEIVEPYERACRTGELALGRVQVIARATAPSYVVSFPTKGHWRDPSKREDVAAGLESLVAEVAKRGIRSIAIPALGCGLGGLEWAVVKPLILAAFARSDGDLRVVLFEPQE